MDPNNNPIERILDLAHSEHNLHSLINLENSHPLDSYPLFFNNNDSKNYQKNDFLPMSPNLFKHQRKNSSEFGYQFKNLYSSNQHPINRKLLFEEDQYFSKWNFIDKESQFPFNSENANMFKKTDGFQFSMKQKIQTQQKKYPSFLQFKMSKNQRGLKSLSEIIYEMLKKSDKLTLNNVAQQLVTNFRIKCLEQNSVLQQSAQKNIRRRTYDALNVLISAGIVKKVGKSISLKSRENNIKIEETKTIANRARQVTKRQVLLQQLKDQLQQRITRRKIILRKKRQQYENLVQRKINIQKFFQAKKWEEIDGQYKREKNEKENDQKLKQRIDFPFLCINTNSGNFKGVSESSNKNGNNKRVFGWQKDNSSTCDLYNKQQVKIVTLHFQSKNIFQSIAIEGDVDFISNLGSMIVAENTIKEYPID